MVMSDEEPLKVEFTLVLYGVVVANAIYELTFGIEFRNAMSLFAFAVILGDWLEYRIDLRNTRSTPANYALAFVLDVVILITWYFLTILPPADLDWFFGVAAAFFLLQALWDRLLLRSSLRTLLRRPELQLTLAFLAFAAVYSTGNVPRTLALAVATGVFLARKAPVWHRLLQKSPEAL